MFCARALLPDFGTIECVKKIIPIQTTTKNTGRTIKIILALFQLPAKLTLTEDSRVLTTVPSPSPSPSPSSGPPSAKGARASKWGRLLGSSSVDSASDTSTKVAVSRSLSARESLRESAQVRASSSSSSNGGQGNKVAFSVIVCTVMHVESHLVTMFSLSFFLFPVLHV